MASRISGDDNFDTLIKSNILQRVAVNFPGTGNNTMAGAVYTPLESVVFTKLSPTSILKISCNGLTTVGNGQPAVCKLYATIDGVRNIMGAYSTYDNGYTLWISGYFGWSAETQLDNITAGVHTIVLEHYQNGYTLTNGNALSVWTGRAFFIEEVEVGI